MTRRELLQLAVTSAASAAPVPLTVGGKPVEIVVAPAGKHTIASVFSLAKRGTGSDPSR